MARPNAPQFMKSIDQLSGLATAIQAFDRRFQELQNHLDFIQTTIDAGFSHYKSRQLQRTEQLMPVLPETAPLQHETQSTQTVTETTTNKVPRTRPQRRSELHYLCQMMCSRGLKKYVVTHLSDIEGLRRDAASALKSAPNPAKLVLDCVGRFFLQGKKAYTKNSRMVSSRQASILMLEFFLRLIAESESHIEIDSSLKQEAEKGAIAWRKRLLSEGGLSKACEIDARGLLLFIACFGIPRIFGDEDVRDLIMFSNFMDIGDLIKRSSVLAARIPDVIENMKKNGLHVEAVDLVYNFGIEDKFSPYTILTSFLQESYEAWKRKRQDAPIPLKEANEKHLAALKSVVKCIEDRKMDPSKLLAEWEIKEKIVKLEKDIADLNKQITDNNMMPKRKAGEKEPSNKLNSQEKKRSRVTGNASSLVSSPHVIKLHEPMVAHYADRKSSHDNSTPHLLDGGLSGYINSHLAASAAPHGYEAGPLPDVLGNPIGGGRTAHAVGVEVGVSAASGVLPKATSSFGGAPREKLVDTVGQMMYGSDSSYGWQRVRDAAYNDMVIGQNFAGQPSVMGVDGLYKPPSHFPGLLDPASVGVGNQNSSSDLYSFADAVV